MNFKAALKSGFYDFMSARDSYRVATAAAGLGMHQDSVRYYAETQALMVCVIAPHWAEFIWREVLLKVCQYVVSSPRLVTSLFTV